MSIQSLVECGSKVWLDSVELKLANEYRSLGATGATSNPVIIAGLIKSSAVDKQLDDALGQAGSDSVAAWNITDQIVRATQQVFLPVWQSTGGNDGYVSFELDPLLEDVEQSLPFTERVDQYIELGKQWSAGHENRMIKVPATPAGLDALEELVAAGISVNVTLVFTARQYQCARDAVWRGAQRRENLNSFKSVYSIFVSRVDIYTQEHVPALSTSAQGLVGIVNAKRIWKENSQFWSDKGCPLAQEIVFASTGTKDPADSPDKYVRTLAGSDIQTNPPATNEFVQSSGGTYSRQVDVLPSDDILSEIDAKVDMDRLETVLMDEGIKKFADPQKALLALIAERRAERAA